MNKDQQCTDKALANYRPTDSRHPTIRPLPINTKISNTKFLP